MIKVFVGCAPDGLDAEAQMVFEYSLKKFCVVECEIVWLKDNLEDKEDPLYSWDMGHWETPYCGFRWAVPELSEFKGDSLYLDFNHIVLSDVSWLMELPWKDDGLIMTPKDNKFAMMRFNNEKIQKYLPTIEEMAQCSTSHTFCCQYFSLNKRLLQYLPGDWGPDPVFCIGDLAQKRLIYYQDLYNMYLKEYGYNRLRQTATDHWFDIYVDKKRPKNFGAEVFDEYYHEALNNSFTVEQYTNVVD